MQNRILNLESLTLWPGSSELDPRTLRFARGKVNYIWSPHRTGKSCFWPALDYLLGAKRPRLPVGPVAGAIAWYQGRFEQADGVGASLMLARGGPGRQRIESVQRDQEGMPTLPLENSPLPGYLDLLNAGSEQLPLTPFGSTSSRDLVLLNHLPQHGLGDPHSFVSSSQKSYSRFKLGYVLQSMFGTPDATSALNDRYSSRVRSRQHPMRLAVENVQEEFHHLAGLAHQVGVLAASPETLVNQPHELVFRELEAAVRRLTLRQIRADHLDEAGGEDVARRSYELGVLAGRIAELLRLSGIAIDELRRLDAALNREFDVHERTLAESTVRGLSESVSEVMHRCVQLMGLDQIPGTIRIDPEAMSVFIEGAGKERIPLTEIGGQQNYVGYNIAALLALHIGLRTHGHTLVRPVLVIDQPSQAFYAVPEQDARLRTSRASLLQLDRLYEALDEIVGSTPLAPMVIVLERAPPERLAEMRHSVAVEGWCDDSHGLLPHTWLHEDTP
jgi:hypothetical protein